MRTMMAAVAALALCGLAATTSARADDGFVIDLSHGAIEVMTSAAFADAFEAEPPDTSRGPQLAALRFAGAWTARKHSALGALLLFEPAR